MPNSAAARYRQQAEECRQSAAKAIRAEDKPTWLRLAEDWLGLLPQDVERQQGHLTACSPVARRQRFHDDFRQRNVGIKESDDAVQGVQVREQGDQFGLPLIDVAGNLGAFL
jgi:hypothetical protein